MMKGKLSIQIISLSLAILAVLNCSVLANDLPSGEIPAGEVRFAVVGDTGTGGKMQNVVAGQMLKLQHQSRFDLLLFLGDNIYPTGSPGDFEKKFLKPYQGLIQNGIELRGCIGNHDARNRFGVLLQQMVFSMGAKTYYSFSRRNDLIEFFALDSTILLNQANETERNLQISWFEKNLERSKAVWKVVLLHHPLYSSSRKHGLGSRDEGEMLRIRELIEPLLQKYQVDVVLSGHDHVYERPVPQAGVQYFISGTGGKLRKGDLNRNTPFFGFGNDEVNSFILFSVNHERTEFWAVDDRGNILDYGKILKNNSFKKRIGPRINANEHEKKKN